MRGNNIKFDFPPILNTCISQSLGLSVLGKEIWVRTENMFGFLLVEKWYLSLNGSKWALLNQSSPDFQKESLVKTGWLDEKSHINTL